MVTIDVVTAGNNSERISALAEELSGVATRHGLKVATAESLTAGNIAAALGRAPAAGDWFLGGIVAYHRRVKHGLLKVPPGPVVNKTAAIAMAESTAYLLRADLTLAVTGEAGPDPQEAGVAPGTVWFGIVEPGLTTATQKIFDGPPAAIVAGVVEHAVELLLRHAYSVAAI
jgi:nicotinamide-nucleotide amidase